MKYVIFLLNVKINVDFDSKDENENLIDDIKVAISFLKNAWMPKPF